MSTAVFCALAINKRIDEFIKTGTMGKNKLKVLSLVVKKIVKSLVCPAHFVRKQIHNSVLADIFLAVTLNQKSRVQVSIIPESFFNIFHVEAVFSKKFLIRLKLQVSSVWNAGLCITAFAGKLVSLGKFNNSHLSIADRGCTEIRRKGVSRLNSDTVHTDSLLKNRVIVFCTGVYVTYTVFQLSKRDSPSIVTDFYTAVFNFNVDSVTKALGKFINRVINTFL